jgi:hypothetical protein
VIYHRYSDQLASSVCASAMHIACERISASLRRCALVFFAWPWYYCNRDEMLAEFIDFRCKSWGGLQITRAH